MRNLVLLLVFIAAVAVPTVFGGSCSVDSGTMFAGQTRDGATYSITNDGKQLTFSVTARDGWSIWAWHIFVATSGTPFQTKNPPPGSFPYQDSFPTGQQSFTFTVALQDVGLDISKCGSQKLNSTIHLEIRDSQGGSETAWSFSSKGNSNAFDTKGRWGWWSTAVLCCSVESCVPSSVSGPIFGGQTIHTGDFSLTNDGSNLIFSFTSVDDWEVSEYHIWVGGLLASTAFGKWPVKSADDFVPSSTFTVIAPFSAFDSSFPDLECGSQVNVSIHQVVSNGESSETAIAKAEKHFNFDVKNSRWGWLFPYIVSCCTEGGNNIVSGSDTTGSDPVSGCRSKKNEKSCGRSRSCKWNNGKCRTKKYE